MSTQMGDNWIDTSGYWSDWSIMSWCYWSKNISLLKITAQVVETSVTVNNNSPIQDYAHPDDQTQPTFEYIYYLIFVHFPTWRGGLRV